MWKVLLCMFLFPLIYTGLITFRALSEENLKPLTRLTGFYSSPAVIFYWNVLSYFGFLWLFAYVLMIDFQVTPSWKELLLYIWLFTLVCEEIRQTLLTQIWWGELAVDTRMWKVLLCMFLFPLIYTGLITFRRDGEIKKRNPRRDMGSNDSVALSSSDKKLRSRSRALSEENLKPLTRLTGFYSSPAVIFYWNVLSYFGFLWLFAYVLMIDFQVTPSWKELLLYIWLFTLVCEEIRQFFHDPDGFGFRRKAVIYFSDPWNQFDVVSICIFIAGLACRLTPTAFYEGRIILALDFNIWCLHLMAIFTVNKNLGPKIIIVKRMMKDIFFFLFLLVVWVVAYGVANQAILVHNEERLEWIFRGAVYEPYLTIFGHIPEKIDNKDFDISRCTVAGTDPLKPKCPVLSDNNQPAFPHWVTIIFLCIYLLFANILLLNLLIAMFNYTFQDVQDNTDKIWKFQRYGLIVEYHSQPPFPPPLIIFSHLHLLIERIFCKPKARKQFKEKLPENEETVLLSWEAFMKENYLTDLRNELNQSTDNKIRDTSEKVGMMVDSLERDHERQCGIVEKRLAHLEEQVHFAAYSPTIYNSDSVSRANSENHKENPVGRTGLEGKGKLYWFGPNRALDPIITRVGMMVDSLERDHERQCGIVEKRLAHLEEQALQSAKALNWIMNALKNKGYGCQDEVPLLLSNSKSIDTADMNSTEESEDGNPQYHLNARQLLYPASSVKRFPVPDEKVPWEVHFAAYSPTIYNSDSVSRANSENHKENPVGRTGLEGKGKLYWFGPNRALDPIITRWKRSSDDSVSKTGTKKVLEFIAIKCKEYDCWAFPGGVLQVGETLPKRLKQLLNTKLQEEVQSMLGAATKVTSFEQECERCSNHCLALNSFVNRAGNAVCNFWKRSSDDSVSKTGTKKVLEFIAIKCKEYDCWAFPGGVLQVGETLPKRLKQLLNTKLQEEVQSMLGAATKVYEGYVDDPRNTDNAWVETTAINIHFDDTKHSVLEYLNTMCLQDSNTGFSVRWQAVDQKIPLYGNHKEILQKVAQIHNAHY
ncbi:UNVERIFIED_CONTAM: hypothetical protein FKN15_041851 [Acipenser sinensis]